MNTALATIRKPPKEALAQLEKVVVEGNLATLTEGERIAYYARVCESLGLNPLTRPFEYITLNGKLTLYARKDATDQLRQINGVSIEKIERDRDDALGLAIVTAYATDRTGRTDSAIGVVSIKGLSGEALANALMKAETKARRRVTLSIAGLGWLDEIEAEERRAVEVVPRAARHTAIASRTAALTGGATEQPGHEPGQEPAPAPVTQPRSDGVDAEATDTSANGEAGPARAPASSTSLDEPVAPDAPPRRPRGQRPAPAAQVDAPDPEYWSRRVHAGAREKGLDDAGLRLVAAAVAEVPAGDIGKFSRKDLTDAQWEAIDAVLRSLPDGVADEDEEKALDAVSDWVYQRAVAKQIPEWPAIDAVARDANGKEPDELSVAEWTAFGIRLLAGEYDAVGAAAS